MPQMFAHVKTQMGANGLVSAAHRYQRVISAVLRIDQKPIFCVSIYGTFASIRGLIFIVIDYES